jgi:hypothetical protein
LTFSWDYVRESNFDTTVNLSIVDVTNVTSPTSIWPAGISSVNTYPVTTKTGIFTYSQSIYSVTPDKRTYELRVDRKNKTRIPKYTDIEWAYRIYYGSSTGTAVTPLTITTSFTNVLATQSVGSFTISGTGYKYFVVPNNNSFSFTNMTYYNLPIALAYTQSYTLIENGNNYATLSVTNAYSVNTIYRVYRTLNQISGTLSVNITK